MWGLFGKAREKVRRYFTIPFLQQADSPQASLQLAMADEPTANPLPDARDAIEQDELSPRATLEKLYELKKLSRD